MVCVRHSVSEKSPLVESFVQLSIYIDCWGTWEGIGIWFEDCRHSTALPIIQGGDKDRSSAIPHPHCSPLSRKQELCKLMWSWKGGIPNQAAPATEIKWDYICWPISLHLGNSSPDLGEHNRALLRYLKDQRLFWGWSFSFLVFFSFLLWGW